MRRRSKHERKKRGGENKGVKRKWRAIRTTKERRTEFEEGEAGGMCVI